MPLSHTTFLALIHQSDVDGRFAAHQMRRRRHSCLDAHLAFVQAQLVQHLETGKAPRSVRSIAQALSQRLGRRIAHTTLSRFISSRGLYREKG